MFACTDTFYRVVFGLLVSVSLFVGFANAESIPVQLLSKSPVVNGDGREWDDSHASVVSLKNISPNSTIKADHVTVNAGIYGNSIYLYLVWEDATHDQSHKSWVWDNKKNKYIQGADREDRMALQFEISGDYTTDWFSGNEFHADMWHWKSSRSNPLRLAHDKSTRVSNKNLLRSYQHTTESGKQIYLARPSDSGSKLYNSQRFHGYKGERMPKYKLNDNVSGSIADIEAYGEWIDGQWHLELRRVLNTGNADDVVLKPGNSVRAGIAIFDHSDNHDHAISETLIFNLPDRVSAELTEK